jgi:biopolymer transport protein ExbB/TolQ
MSHDFYQVVFKIAAKLELPVVVLTLLGLLAVVLEIGAFAVESVQHLRRRFPALVTAADKARGLVDKGEREDAGKELAGVAWAPAMAKVLTKLATYAGTAGGEALIAKQLADFDFDCQRRLARTRLLVRTGPALGLMGTLIPLSPALEGLARGNVSSLTDNLQLAFSVTVLGLLVGVVAFGLSLFRDRIYGQGFSDLEYVAAVLTDERVDAR